MIKVMVKYILGKKVGMTQLFNERGVAFAVTLINAGPCVVTQLKTVDKDGYAAAQIGFESTRKNNKPAKGHFKDLGGFKFVREFRPRRTDLPAEWQVGRQITVEQFAIGDKVKVSGLMKGRGFQGGVKRHGFSGGQRSHGHRHVLRTIGSIGASYPERVWKGKRMPGQYGNARISIKNINVVAIDAKDNLLALQGAVPGARGSFVIIEG